MASRNAPNKSHQQSTQAAGRELRPTTRDRRPTPISSHPDADPEAPAPSDAALDTPTQEDFQRGPDAERPKPIVSINGSDVEPEKTDCNAA